MTVLADLIREHGWRRGVELGVWQGETLAYLLRTFPALRMIGVDNWAAVGPYARKNMAAAEQLARVVESRHPHRCYLVKEDTVAGAQYVADGSVDFVFIDASHDTESVLGDIVVWEKKLRVGGMLTGHDANWPSVRAALDSAVPGWKLLDANVWIQS